jgi:hypothetical protein
LLSWRDNLVVEEPSYETVLDHLERGAHLVLDDLQEAHPDVLRVERHSDAIRVCGPGLMWTGLHPENSRAQNADFATDLVAEKVQEMVVELFYADSAAATWPACPEHPGAHPLSPEAGSWRCPTSGSVVSPIGRLAGT